MSRLFVLEPNRGGIRLGATVAEITDVLERKLIAAILRQADPPLDRQAVAEVLFGAPGPLPPETEARLAALEALP